MRRYAIVTGQYLMSASLCAKPRGRQFFFNPGPTNIPDRVLRAMHRAPIDFFSDEFLEIQQRTHAGIKRLLRTEQHLLFYAANGHGAWEAALANLFIANDRLLMLESGHFSASWARMASELELAVETLEADWRRGINADAVAERLKGDQKGEIKAVLVVHNETSTGLVHPIASIRHAIDEARHPALLLVDTISSLGSMDFRMDEWGADVVVGASQKGLMMTTGLSFTGISERALAKSETVKTPRSYWNWKTMRTMAPQRFPGTTPVHLFFGLDEGIRVLEEEGLDAVFLRHHQLATATRAAIAHWSGGTTNDVSLTANGLSGPVRAIELLAADPTRASNSVSAILVPNGHDANALREVALERYNLSLGGGLGSLAGHAFRIGHMGDLNEPMLLGALATTELTMKLCGVPHQAGGVEAAIGSLIATGPAMNHSNHVRQSSQHRLERGQASLEE
jgi:alanine-glyoxylate transaminase/serine-glyoxylate transaminase/serine-pyruvate transaminase